MYSCRRVTHILGAEEPLSLRGRIELRIHLWMCVHCRNYARQLRSLGKAYRALVDRHFSKADLERLKDQIKEKTGANKV